MSNKNTFLCHYCQKYIQAKTKEEYLSHKEQCSNKLSTNEVFRDTNESSGHLNIASFTFGGKHETGPLKEMMSENSNVNFNSMKVRKNSEDEEVFIFNNKNSSFSGLGGIGISNKIDQHNSYVSAVIQQIWNMKHLRNYILNDMIINEEPRNKFISNLKVFFF